MSWLRRLWRRLSGARAPAPAGSCEHCGGTDFFADYDEVRQFAAMEVFRSGKTIAGNVRYTPDGRVCQRCGLDTQEIG